MVDMNSYLLQQGNVCTQWSYVEYLLSNAIWYMLNINRSAGVIVTGNLEITVKAKMAHDLSKELCLDEGLIDVLNKARKDIDRISPSRNRIVHGVFSSSPNVSIPKIEVHRGKEKGVRKDITVNEMLEVGNKISVVSKYLRKEFEKIGINIR